MTFAKGSSFAAEWSEERDPVTGTRVVQLTSQPFVSHPSYFLQSSFLPAGDALFCTSYRSGTAQLWLISLGDGTLRQLTDGPSIHPFSPAYSNSADEIVFTRAGSLWALRLTNLSERRIIEMDGAQFGEPSLSSDGQYATTAFRRGSEQGLAVGRLDGTGWTTISFPRTVIHPQFHPLEPGWLEFAGDPAPRMHRVRRDGTGLECLLDHSNDEFIVHETFLGATGDVVFTVWPYRLCRMDWTTLAISVIAEHNCWHIAPDRAGARILSDTNHPDRGIQLVNVNSGEIANICSPRASNLGSQWKHSRYALAEDFARARDKAAETKNLSWMEASTDTVYGPQWTHPHPSWSHDEEKIAFASDRTGTTQVYVADLPAL